MEINKALTRQAREDWRKKNAPIRKFFIGIMYRLLKKDMVRKLSDKHGQQFIDDAMETFGMSANFMDMPSHGMPVSHYEKSEQKITMDDCHVKMSDTEDIIRHVNEICSENKLSNNAIMGFDMNEENGGLRYVGMFDNVAKFMLNVIKDGEITHVGEDCDIPNVDYIFTVDIDNQCYLYGYREFIPMDGNPDGVAEYMEQIHGVKKATSNPRIGGKDDGLGDMLNDTSQKIK